MKNYLHIIIAVLPSYFAYFCEAPYQAVILVTSTLFFGFYNLLCICEEPYQGAHKDNKTMWLVHIVGTMLIIALQSSTL